jgi:hypothetical protein
MQSKPHGSKDDIMSNDRNTKALSRRGLMGLGAAIAAVLPFAAKAQAPATRASRRRSLLRSQAGGGL